MENSKKTLQTLDQYLAIGFDADHCLVNYKLHAYFSIVYRLMTQYLVNEKSYPAEILEFGKQENSFIFNGLVVDFKTGYILKLGENKVILRAYFGYDKVSQEDLETHYGSPPKFEIFDPYQCRTNDYQCCVSFAECFFPAILAHMIAYKKKTHHLEDINAREIFKDAHSVLYKIIGQWAKEILDKPDAVMYKQDSMKQRLKNLREKGKILFLASNGPSHYLSGIMKYAYGEDWASLFDFIIPGSGKPGFFSSEDSPFYGLDEKGNAIKDEVVTEMKRHQLYTGGNAKTLEDNIKAITGESDKRVLFIGDHYSTDVLAAETIKHWDAVCIVEEMGGVNFGELYDQTYWGNWEYEETPNGRVETFWYHFLKNNVAKCVPLIDSKEMVEFFDA